MTEYLVETDDKKSLKTFRLQSANRKAALLSKAQDTLSYVVAVVDGVAVGHRIYANGRFLRQEGRGF